MGGQACVFYGAAQFSRDTDFVILCDPPNLQRLSQALDELQAECIAVPPFEAEYLLRGHAVHFRCRAAEAAGMRVDVLAKMRGVEPFEALWERRTVLADAGGEIWDLLGIPDLVQAKKTQRDKDWPMIRALVEAHFMSHSANPTPDDVRFWFREARSPEILRQCVRDQPAIWQEMIATRPLLRILADDRGAETDDALQRAMLEEELAERALDRAYWQPLRAELERLRRDRLKG